jgi:sarcosine oxidase subunit alpha
MFWSSAAVMSGRAPMASIPTARHLIDDGPSADSEIAKAATILSATLTVLSSTTVIGLYDHGYAIAAQRRPTPAIEGRLWHIRAGRTVIATGATERPIVFADNDRPGIMLASSAAT